MRLELERGNCTIILCHPKIKPNRADGIRADKLNDSQTSLLTLETLKNRSTRYQAALINGDSFGDAIHTHFVTLIGKWTIVGGWVKHRADKRGNVVKIKS